MSTRLIALVCVATCAVLGCGQSSTPADSAKSTAETPAKQAALTPSPDAQIASDDSPANAATSSGTSAPTLNPPQRTVRIPANLTPPQIVQMFLDALRGGDDVTATALLTDKARTEIAKVPGLTIQPPGTPSTQFQLGEVKFSNGDAIVPSVLRDQSPSGESFEVKMMWILRGQPENWRVAGMVAPAGGQMVLMNFENPQDMISKWEAEQARLAALEKEPAPPQGQIPPTTPPSGGRVTPPNTQPISPR